MRRRDLLIGAGVAAIMQRASLGARAEQKTRVYRIGMLVSAPRNAPHHVALLESLRLSGFVAGENLSVDWSGYGLSADQFQGHAAELLRARPDAIHAGGDAALGAAQNATSTIPIVALTDDMLGKRFVQSLSKPGGNTTGVTILASELDGKRQEILTEAVPGPRHLAALADENTSKAEHLSALEADARGKGYSLSIHRVADAGQIVQAIDGARASGADALNVLASALLFNNRKIIFDRVAALHLPAIYQWPEMAAEGGFIAYGPRIVQLYGDVVSRQLIAVLRGTRPGELPVEQPTKFEMAINLKSAKLLGIAVPPVLLAQADEVIE